MGFRGRSFLAILSVSALGLAACGKHFPVGERLLPESYGPPFGPSLEKARPHHPHNPASSERHALADERENRVYGSYAACNAALRAQLTAHAGAEGPTAISSVEAVGHYEAAGVVHEYRCAGPSLSTRSWRQGGEGHGDGHGESRHGDQAHDEDAPDDTPHGEPGQEEPHR